jgi:hypothetical protein
LCALENGDIRWSAVKGAVIDLIAELARYFEEK